MGNSWIDSVLERVGILACKLVWSCRCGILSNQVPKSRWLLCTSRI